MQTSIALPIILCAALVAGVIAAVAPQTPIDGLADDAAAAARSATLGARDMADAKAVVLLLDEKSLDASVLVGTPRALMSPLWTTLTEKALTHGADSVALDFILAFDGADLRLGETQPLKSYDTLFLRLLMKESRAGRLLIGRSKDMPPARRFASVAGAAGVAYVDTHPDGDGVVRRMRLGHTLEDGTIAPTLAGALLAARAVDAIPITPSAPLTHLPTASVIDVLICDNPEALRRLFTGRVVLVGSGLPSEDRVITPDRFMARTPAPSPGAPCDFVNPPLGDRGRSIPGVYLHAAAVDAVRSGWALTPLSPEGIGLTAAAAAVLAALAGLWLGSVWLAAMVAACVGVIGFVGAAWAQEIGYLTYAARPAFGAVIGFAFAWAGRLVFLGRRARTLRTSFARYVAPEVIDRLLKQDRLPELDGEHRHVTIMFADLSGFTALSEQVDGKTLTAIVNRYLSLIAAEVARSGGYVDKFIGDAVMAIWNAPADLADHEQAAISAAVAIRDAVAAEAARDREQDLPGFSIKIGLNSGSAVVGNVGSPDRLNYTAVGDVVNVAARLEGLPHVFGTPVLIGAACAKAAMDQFAMLEIASIQVKGRAQSLAVFAPLSDQDRRYFSDYAAALTLYRAQQFAAAAKSWRALGKFQWTGADLSVAMAGLADAVVEHELDDAWDGAIVMQTK